MDVQVLRSGPARHKPSSQDLSSIFIYGDVWDRVASFLDCRDVAAFRASCQLGRQCTSALRERLLFNTVKRPHVTWGNKPWLGRFLGSFKQLRSIKLRDPGNNYKGFGAILQACLSGASRARTQVDGFHTGSPYWFYRSICQLASPQLRFLELDCPSLCGTRLNGELLLDITEAFPLLEEFTLRGYCLALDLARELGDQAPIDDEDDDEDDEEEEEDGNGGAGQQQAAVAANAGASVPPQPVAVPAEPRLPRRLKKLADFHPRLLAPIRATLTTLRLHCWTSGPGDLVSEEWALALADLTNLRTLDLATGMGAFGTPRARPLGMPVPWTRGVAEAWRAGLRQLNHLSVRLALRCDGLNGDNPLPLQTHNMPLPVGGHTTHLGMFIDDHGQELDDFDEHTVTGLILLVSTLLAGCLSGLKSLDLSLAGPGGPEGNFGLGTLLRTMANSPLAQLGELLTPAAGGIGPKVLRRLTLDLEAAALLAGALPVLLSPPGDDAGCGGGVVTTVVASALGPFTDLLAALSALRGTRVALRLACYESLLDNAPEAVAESLAAMGPHAAALALPANPDSGELENALQQRMGELRELEVAFDTPYTLPPMSQRKAWTEHLRELDLLGAVGCLTRLGLTFKRSLKNMEGEIVHWHEAADVDAHLAAVVRACPQLKALDITIIEDKLLDEDEGERALASWRGAKAAAAAGADLDRWRPAGCPNPVPSLHCLANLPALERLSLQLDVITTQGLSGLVEDEVRMLLETVEKRRSWRRQQRAEAEAEAGQERNEEAALPEPPLSVWCPQLSRDAARRLSRLAAQLAGRETAPGGGWDGETWLVDCTHRG